ncbi:hypothetical protein IKQ26_02925 [bacterium]|nr:hypothetical protein [bacterium]
MKVGFKWKSIEGLSRGKLFKITEITSEKVFYKSEETGKIYCADRKFFEKYIERVNKFWSEKNKTYKNKKEKLKNER